MFYLARGKAIYFSLKIFPLFRRVITNTFWFLINLFSSSLYSRRYFLLTFMHAFFALHCILEALESIHICLYGMCILRDTVGDGGGSEGVNKVSHEHFFLLFKPWFYCLWKYTVIFESKISLWKTESLSFLIHFTLQRLIFFKQLFLKMSHVRKMPKNVTYNLNGLKQQVTKTRKTGKQSELISFFQANSIRMCKQKETANTEFRNIFLYRKRAKTGINGNRK